MKRISFLLASLAVFYMYQYKQQSDYTLQVSPMGGESPDDPHSLLAWNLMRLADPVTGKIPENIRQRELEFAENLPKNYSRSINWELIGPRDLGGRTRAVAFDVRNDSIILAGGVTGGIWKSVNGGQSFYKVTNPANLHSVTCLVQDSRAGHEDTWYAGTGEFYGVTAIAAFSCRFSGNGIFKSVDNGENWTLLSSTASNTPQTIYTNGDMDHVWKIVTDKTNLAQDVVLAAIYNGIKRSTDGGTTWNTVLGVDTSQVATSDYCELIQTDNGIFYATLSSDGVDKGLYRSDDGINWTDITPVGFAGSYKRCVMAFNPQNNNEILFLCETPSVGNNGHSLWKYTYLSGNGSGAGGQWENRTSGMSNYTCTGYFTFDFGKFNSQGSYDLCIAWDPTDDSVVYLGGTNIYRSDNQFVSNTSRWIGGYRCNTEVHSYVYPNHHPDQHGMIFYPSNPARMLSFNDGGMYYSENLSDSLVTWTPLNNRYTTSQFYTVAIESGNASSHYLTCGAQDNGTWYTNANHIDSLWTWAFNGDGSFSYIPNGRDYYIVSIQQGKMYKTEINHAGDTNSVRRIDPNQNATNQFINPFIADPLNPNRIYMVQNLRIQRHSAIDLIPLTGEIYDTLQQGWSIVPNSALSFSDQAISAIEMSPAAPDVVFYGSAKGRVYKLINASQPTATRTNISSALFPTGAYVSSISVNPFDANDIFVSFSNYNVRSLFHTVNGGTTWENVSGNLEQFPDGTGNGPSCYWVETYPSWPTPTYFVGTSIGLFSTTQLDSNSVWVQEGPTSIGNVNVNMIVARPYDGKIAVATHGNGIYTGYLTPAYLQIENKPADPFFTWIYPNPSDGNCVVEYTVKERSTVSVEILDLQGKTLYTHVAGMQSTGSYTVPVNLQGRLEKGTYLVCIRQNDRKLVKKWIVK